jgi:hypothetical protein
VQVILFLQGNREELEFYGKGFGGGNDPRKPQYTFDITDLVIAVIEFEVVLINGNRIFDDISVAQKIRTPRPVSGNGYAGIGQPRSGSSGRRHYQKKYDREFSFA